MERLFEILASINGVVEVNIGSDLINITGEIVSTEKFADGLTLYFDNDVNYFISSIYNRLEKYDEEINEYVFYDSVHSFVVTIRIVI